MENTETNLQRKFFADTAGRYDELHLKTDNEHYFALSFLTGFIDYLQIQSVLDIGSGTGRAIAFIKEKYPHLRVVGIEPVKEMREVGHQKGLSESELIDGNANAIEFRDGEFDLVCEFGVLHHIKDHQTAVSEMLRVANKAVFISDSNKFGQGSKSKKFIQRILNKVGLWETANYINTKGKGYHVSEGDGVFYSYSVFDDYELIKKNCKSVHVLNTSDAGINPYNSASHVALLGVKNRTLLN